MKNFCQYGSLVLTTHFKHRRGPLEWLADVGGSLGLYLGASVFTVLELGWLGIVIVKRCLWRKCAKPKEPPREKENGGECVAKDPALREPILSDI